MAAILRVVLGEDNVVVLDLPNGIPPELEDLKAEIKGQHDLLGNFRLQFRDARFDNDFVNLTSTSLIKDRSTVKVIYLTNESGTTPHDGPLPYPTLGGPSGHLLQGSDDSSFSASDTDILSSASSSNSLPSTDSGSSLRSQPWPQTFTIPQFAVEIEHQLAEANNAYCKDGTPLSPGTRLKSGILDVLVKEIVKYKMYPESEDLEQVARALVAKHPCLGNQGTGYGGWKISLSTKMNNYRQILRNTGYPELILNSVKRRKEQGASNISPNQVKKPRKAEVNFLPNYPEGETTETLEAQRQALVLEHKQRNSNKNPQIKMKMERTFAYRRQEIITEMPFIAQLQSRWPALFTPSEVNAEFTRITTKPLVSTFMSQLDHYTDPLLKAFRKKGGTAGLKITGIMAAIGKNPSVEKRRECILKALCVYLNESPDNLIKESMDVDPDAQQAVTEQLNMAVYVIQHEGSESTDDPEEVNIIIEGVEVLQDVKDVANGCALLLGLIYCLNLEYPSDLRYTFEFIQKVMMDMDGQKLSRKVRVLKGKLYE